MLKKCLIRRARTAARMRRDWEETEKWLRRGREEQLREWEEDEKWPNKRIVSSKREQIKRPNSKREISISSLRWPTLCGSVGYCVQWSPDRVTFIWYTSKWSSLLPTVIHRLYSTECSPPNVIAPTILTVVHQMQPNECNPLDAFHVFTERGAPLWSALARIRLPH